MANLERKTYDPRTDDLRSQDFDDEEPSEQEGARLPLLVVLALLVLAAFSGVVWLAYTQGIERGRAEGPESLAAQAVHKAPANTLPFLGLNIYQAPANGRTTAQKTGGPIRPKSALPSLRPTSNGGPESFAAGTEPTHPFAASPPASTALAVPNSGPVKPSAQKLAGNSILSMQKAPPPHAATAAAVPSLGPEKSVAQKPGGSSTLSMQSAAPTAAPASTRGPLPSLTPATPAAQKSALGSVVASQNPRPQTTPTPAPKRATVPNPMPVKPAVQKLVSSNTASTPNVSSEVAHVNGILLQIGSYKSEAEAKQSWQAFQAKHSAARGYQPDIRQVDLGAKGTWYRLRIGPFDDKDSAAEACAKLRSDGASCLIAR